MCVKTALIHNTTSMKINFKLTLLSVIFLSLSNLSQAQVGIGTSTPHSSAQLEINSNNKGFLPPRMTTAERNAILSPAEGLMIFNTTSKSLNIYYNGVWQQVTNTTPVGTINTLTAGSPSGTLIWGVPASEVSGLLAYTNANGETYTAQEITSTGVTGLKATIPAGNFALGDGNLNYTISGTPDASGTATFALNIASKALSLTRTVDPGTIASLTTGTTTNGTLTGGIVASGVSSVVSYTGGNGGKYAAQTASSTGVTGLTATLIAGNFAVGNGTLTYAITGTPSAGGTASFALNIGGKTATLTRSVTQPPCGAGYDIAFTYRGAPVTYGTIQGANNRCWLDRHLGASSAATSMYQYVSDGFFQWGRRDDEHQVRTSNVLSGYESNTSPTTNYFRRQPDWRSPSVDDQWQPTNGVNNPCPTGWRVPTETEWNTEINSWPTKNSDGGYNKLKLNMAGYRWYSNGTEFLSTNQGYYWTSTAVPNTSTNTYFPNNYTSKMVVLTSTSASVISDYRGNGALVRCIKNQ